MTRAGVLLLALLLGVSVCFQGIVNGKLAGRIGVAGATLVNGIVFGAAVLAWWLVAPGGSRALLAEPRVPWHWYAGGVLGVVIVGAGAFAIPRIGAAATLSVAIAAQLVAALAADALGLAGPRVPIAPARVLGVLLLLAGALLVVRQAR